MIQRILKYMGKNLPLSSPEMHIDCPVFGKTTQ
jgi:hypothetical protein